MEYVQQGDLLLFRIGNPGVETDSKEEISKVLLDGEHSGHVHALTLGSKVFKFPADDSGVFAVIDVPKADVVIHDEHGPVALSEGTWVAKQVQQVDVVSVIAMTKRQEMLQRAEIERRSRRVVED
jgi:hypothetical protein